MNTSTEKEAAALQTMLVSRTFGMPRESRGLKSEASNIEEKNKAESGTVGGPPMYYFRKKENNKKIDGLDSLKKFKNAWKTAIDFYARYPFAGDVRILSAALVPKFVELNDSFRKQLPSVIDSWIKDEYPKWLESAPTRMGNLYDPSDFPTAEECKSRFVCEVVIVPMPQADQWQRISIISPDLAKTMEAATNEKIKEAVEKAHAKTWEDMLGPINHIVETLKKDKTKIYESLITNVIAIAELVPSLNQSGDKMLNALASDAIKELGSLNVSDLRKSDEARQHALKKATNLLNAFTPFQRKIIQDGQQEQQETQT